MWQGPSTHRRRQAVGLGCSRFGGSTPCSRANASSRSHQSRHTDARLMPLSYFGCHDPRRDGASDNPNNCAHRLGQRLVGVAQLWASLATPVGPCYFQPRVALNAHCTRRLRRSAAGLYGEAAEAAAGGRGRVRGTLPEAGGADGRLGGRARAGGRASRGARAGPALASRRVAAGGPGGTAAAEREDTPLGEGVLGVEPHTRAVGQGGWARRPRPGSSRPRSSPLATTPGRVATRHP